MMNAVDLGIDIIEIQRVASAIGRNPRMLQRLFTEAELADYRSRGSRMETLAGKFAAKEAAVKALGTGLRGFRWTDVEILPDERGKPCCRLSGEARQAADRAGIAVVLVSVSHNRTLAIANALAIRKEHTDEAGNQ